MSVINLLSQTDSIIKSESKSVAVNYLTSTLRALFFLPSSEHDLKQISLEEVNLHDCIDDCWVVINDHVYDITSFIRKVSIRWYVLTSCLHNLSFCGLITVWLWLVKKTSKSQMTLLIIHAACNVLSVHYHQLLTFCLQHPGGDHVLLESAGR